MSTFGRISPLILARYRIGAASRLRGWSPDTTKWFGVWWTDSHDCLVPLCGMLALLVVFALFHLDLAHGIRFF